MLLIRYSTPRGYGFGKYPRQLYRKAIIIRSFLRVHGSVRAVGGPVSRCVADDQSRLYTKLQVSHPLWSAAKAMLRRDAVLNKRSPT